MAIKPIVIAKPEIIKCDGIRHGGRNGLFVRWLAQSPDTFMQDN
jgi:hypothetical protein